MDRPKLDNKRFGRQMGLALLALAGLGFWRDWADFLTITFLSLAAIHLLLAFIAPSLLTGFNRFWMSLGYYFGKVFAPIEMAFIFFLIFAPVALITRLFGRDALLPVYIESRIFNAMLQSAAAEHAARQKAMKSATENADKLIKNYTRLSNSARQSEITQQISEIVGGADALVDTSDKE